MPSIPVIIGIGEILDRPADLSQALDPLELMKRSLERADEDAGGGFLERLDSLDIVQQVTWRYRDTAARMCERLHHRPARAVYGVTGGESPMRYLHEAALRIANGESNVAAICGGEAQHALSKAKSAGITLPWPDAHTEIEHRHVRESILQPVAIRHGMTLPAQIYPLYENATLAAWGETPRAASAESARLWSQFARVAAENPYSWTQRSFTASGIETPAADNRLITHPYTKRMVANPLVNQGAALILTSLERARAAGIADERMIFIHGGAAAIEPRDYLLREQYVRSDAQDVVLEAIARLVDDGGQELDACELYSCFPVVPKMARRTLERARSLAPTVTGGLSFFGAPLNNYMTHAACAMVRHLRDGKARTGMLYGQGEYVTKHHAVILSREPSRTPLARDYSVQSLADARRGATPPLIDEYVGPASVETHTVVYDRDGSPAFGTVIARTPEDARLMARVMPNDGAGIAALTDRDHSPVGAAGEVRPATDGLLQFSID
jgi:acetyl-CoA C-acetyltransferase